MVNYPRTHLFFIFYTEQGDETWLAEFKQKVRTDWDFTAIHINKNNLDGVKKDVVRIQSPPLGHSKAS